MRFIENHKIGWFIHLFVFAIFWITTYYASRMVWPPEWSALVSTIQLLIGAGIYTFIRLAMIRIEFGGSKITWLGGSLVFVGLVIVLKPALTAFLIEQLPQQPLDPVKSLQTGRTFPIMVSLVPVFMAYVYHGISNQSKKEKRNMALLTQYQLTQIEYLKAQINPHFLFNTLHNIYSLAVIQSPQTPEMVLRLSDLLRYAIYDGAKKLVPVKKEIEQCQKLIELYQMRSRNASNVKLEITGADRGILLEPMLFIPLVENAIKHGDMGRNPEGFAHFSMQFYPRELRFTATNTYSSNPQKDKVGGVGLQNIKKRLEILHQGKHRIEILDTAQVYTVTVEIEYDDQDITA